SQCSFRFARPVQLVRGVPNRRSRCPVCGGKDSGGSNPSRVRGPDWRIREQAARLFVRKTRAERRGDCAVKREHPFRPGKTDDPILAALVKNKTKITLAS